MKRMCVYCRVSTENQDSNFSVQEQEARGVEFAKSQGYEPVLLSETFTGSVLDRPKFLQFYDHMDEFEALWCIETSRLSRNALNSFILLEKLQQYNIKIYVNNELRKYNSPDQKLLFGINAVVDDSERMRIRERFERGANKKRREGGRWSNHPLYGYDAFYDDERKRRIRINIEEAQIVKEIFDAVESGKSQFVLATEFNERRIDTKWKGETGWSGPLIGRYLKKKIYTGYYDFEGREIRSNDYEAIITLAQFNKVQDITSNRRSNTNMRRSEHSGSSVVSCHYCKTAIGYNTRHSHGKTYPAYVIRHPKDCKRDKSLNATTFYPPESWEYLIENIWNLFLEDEVSLYEYAQKEKDKYYEKEEERQATIERVKNRIDEVKSKKQKLLKAFLSIEDEDIANEIKKLSTEQKKEEDYLKSLENEQVNDEKALSELLLKVWHDLSMEYNLASPLAKRKMLASLTESAVIKDRFLIWKWITGFTIKVDIPPFKKAIKSIPLPEQEYMDIMPFVTLYDEHGKEIPAPRCRHNNDKLKKEVE